MEGDDLLRLLDPDPRCAAEKYADLQLRLRKFFQWRNCPSPEDLAQETLRRGFSRINEGVELFADPVHYFFGIARYVAMEQRDHRPPPVEVELDTLPATADVDFRTVEARIHLQQCLRLLEPDERDLLVRYYTDDRKALAAALLLSENALRVRAHRTKRRLELLIGQAHVK